MMINMNMNMIINTNLNININLNSFIIILLIFKLINNFKMNIEFFDMYYLHEYHGKYESQHLL